MSPCIKRLQGIGLVAFLLLAVPFRGAADDLADMDLDALLNIRLNTLGVSSIHHTHPKGEWMISLRHMAMHMDGNRSGTSRRSRSDVLRSFPVAPLEMDMSSSMLHVMYAPTDQLTLMGMAPYLRKSMRHVTRTGRTFTTRTQGLGDIKIGALYDFWRGEGSRVIALGTLSLPTGDISERDETPMGNTILPYPMQLGSGTFDLQPGLTYLGNADLWAWGAHVSGWIRPYRNSKGYRLGHEATVTAWGSRELFNGVSSSLRLDYRHWGNISGADDRLNPKVVPTADPDLRGGRRLDLLLGFNLYQTEGALSGHRIALEAGVPIYQWLEGPQLELDFRWSLEWIWTF